MDILYRCIFSKGREDRIYADPRTSCAIIVPHIAAMENWLWGAPRIHGELLKLKFGVAQSTVAKRDHRGRR